jgi:kynurenine formamidase
VTFRGRFVDLTHPFNDQTIYWPTENGFRLEKGPAGITERGYFYSANRFAAAEHGGTHIDAPIHFYSERDTVDRIALERLIHSGIVVDVTQACAANRDYQIQIADLRAWEEKHGRTLAENIVLLRTAWSKRWPDRKAYLGTERLGQEAVAELHFPGLHPDAARWLVEQRAVRAVGIDTASIDYGQSTHFESHVLLCQHNVPVFENVANLDQLPHDSFTLIALPMKIQGGSGAPLRIIAVLPVDGRR